ncbi:MEDS domain-containing protein [Salinibacter altiplanensis]|uniref:MEDS domain-containing protein n=1 Tax=Salinibacter altiplanensis TaxID=1803181 RepID=UPI000C9EFB97|nr:MEDS domain-containing protein [Salinibacter altiplanensis]
MHTNAGPNSSPDSDDAIPLGVGGVEAAVSDHIAHFFRGEDQRFSVLGPYIETGLRRGDRCVFISQPEVGISLCDWLSERGMDVGSAREADRLILDPGRDTTGDMKRLADRIDASVDEMDDSFVRWSGDGEWCLARDITVEEMLRWEALYDEHSSQWRMLALCQFDLTTFESDVIMDALRTHPYCVMGDVVVPNPFHESPDAVREALTSST